MLVELGGSRCSRILFESPAIKRCRLSVADNLSSFKLLKIAFSNWDFCCYQTNHLFFLKKMSQSRHLFVYFRPFLITVSTIQIEKA